MYQGTAFRQSDVMSVVVTPAVLGRVRLFGVVLHGSNTHLITRTHPCIHQRINRKVFGGGLSWPNVMHTPVRVLSSRSRVEAAVDLQFVSGHEHDGWVVAFEHEYFLQIHVYACAFTRMH